MTKEEWINKLKIEYDYDIYYFSHGDIFRYIRESHYHYEIEIALDFSTFIAIALCE